MELFKIYSCSHECEVGNKDCFEELHVALKGSIILFSRHKGWVRMNGEALDRIYGGFNLRQLD